LKPRITTLPEDRINRKWLFENRTVNFTGPFLYLIQKKREVKVITSGYLHVIKCLTTRVGCLKFWFAVDIAKVLGALQRFTARRKTPSTFLSERGAGFIGAADWITEERHTQGGWRRRRIKIGWKCEENLSGGGKMVFAPPEGPHFNHMAESLVKSVKRCLSPIKNNPCWQLENG
jgi:hypothetical protein